MPLKYLPSARRVLIHLAILITLSCLLGPLLGPWLVNWINPPQAWGTASKVGNYALMNVLTWGLAFMMFEAFFYIGWLIAQGRHDWEKAKPKSWYN